MAENTEVVAIGGGYAGVMAANRLTQRDDVTVTVINPRRVFVPRLHPLGETVTVPGLRMPAKPGAQLAMTRVPLPRSGGERGEVGLLGLVLGVGYLGPAGPVRIHDGADAREVTT